MWAYCPGYFPFSSSLGVLGRVSKRGPTIVLFSKCRSAEKDYHRLYFMVDGSNLGKVCVRWWSGVENKINLVTENSGEYKVKESRKGMEINYYIRIFQINTICFRFRSMWSQGIIQANNPLCISGVIIFLIFMSPEWDQHF